MQGRFAQVIPFVRLRRGLDSFDYSIPEALAGDIKPGSVVMVPFRGKQTQGVVLKIADTSAIQSAKEIYKIPERSVCLAPWQLEVLSWVSAHYFTSMGAVAPLFVPAIPKRAQSGSEPVFPAPAASSGSITLYRYILSGTRRKKIQDIIDADRSRQLQTLIITPFEHDARVLSDTIPGSVLLDTRSSMGSHYASWKKIAFGESSVIIGTRSAVFSPVHRIGTIIIDSEESEFHKQEEPNPRYQVKEVAMRISQKTGCAIALFSMSPSLHSLHEVRNKKYSYAELDSPNTLVAPEIVDMGNEFSGGNFSPISYPLEEAITRSLERKKSIFLFLNRKGVSGAFMCADCGHLFRCAKCSLPYTFHEAGLLKCHHCDIAVSMPATCPKCRSMRLKARGTGTEKLEELIRTRFPSAKVLKLDQDTPLERDESALASAADIIIGTVYALPYLPLSRLGLIGVISADTLFHLPDFRSGERTHGLLTRMHALASEANADYLIQTHTPTAALFDALRHRSIREFYLSELIDRELLGYPPFTRLVRIIIQNSNEVLGKQEAQSLYEKVRSLLGAGCSLTPPVPLHIFCLRDLYRWQIVMKLPPTASLPTDVLMQVADSAIIDVDPETLL